ncbi:MAG: class I SAM-dependent methyltransferase [Gammaproteobacteria bacterium]
MNSANKHYSSQITREGMIMRVGKLLFPFFERLGIHITRNYFSSPIPDTSTLADDLWHNHSELVGINLNVESQLALLSTFMSKYNSDYSALPLHRDDSLQPYDYYVKNGMYESVDGEILYCMIRHTRPQRIFEIGSGNSTYLSAKAILRNASEDACYKCELVAIEPYPNPVLKSGFPGLSKLLAVKVQDCPISEFQRLKENDILFIDSSHAVKIGSDVWYEYLEILPRLNKGVLIHIHDIFLPAEYAKEWVLKNFKFYNEQYLVQAFLTFNNAFEVLWMSHYMHLKHAEKLKEAFPSYSAAGRIPPVSLWIRKIR